VQKYDPAAKSPFFCVAIDFCAPASSVDSLEQLEERRLARQPVHSLAATEHVGAQQLAAQVVVDDQHRDRALAARRIRRLPLARIGSLRPPGCAGGAAAPPPGRPGSASETKTGPQRKSATGCGKFSWLFRRSQSAARPIPSRTAASAAPTRSSRITGRCSAVLAEIRTSPSSKTSICRDVVARHHWPRLPRFGLRRKLARVQQLSHPDQV